MSQPMRTAEQAPKPPPKSRRDLGRLLGRSGRGADRKNKHRTSQYVEPVVHGADDEERPAKHIDVIDQLDISGVHGASLFHHDSPYDACSPHVNQTSNRKAPIRAFGSSADPVTSQMLASHQRGGRTIEPDADSYHGHRAAQPGDDDPFRHRAAADSQSSIGLEPQYDAANPNAEFFGVAAEPWQDFATPAHANSRAYAEDQPSGRSSRSSTFADMETYLRGTPRANTTPAAGAAQDATASRANEVTFDDVPPLTTPTRKGTLRGAGTSRSRSLLGRFRRLRVEPDEPVLADQPAAQLRRNRTYSPQTAAPQPVPPVAVDPAPTTYLASPHADADPGATPRASRSRRGAAYRTATPEQADREVGIEPGSRPRRTRQGMPAVPPKGDWSATPGAADYTAVMGNAEDDPKPSLGRSKTFLSRLANSSRARVI
ncbi:hypothetical protein MBRA1_003375 [Malassezia brasiliensis]|uniref:Pal1 cell morphology protein n=1 Tax=Malassezia brasiliensis TaxID=1821822 RepID=A0AAF0DWK2_9BASI|nr:hypothetical protein MBRA1_003375 [Malassezia brasiliensis]